MATLSMPFCKVRMRVCEPTAVRNDCAAVTVSVSLTANTTRSTSPMEEGSEVALTEGSNKSLPGI